MTSEQWNTFEPTEQIGQLAISQRSHASGVTRWAVMLPAGEKARWNGAGNCPLSPDKVILFGYLDPTRNQIQGWLHPGPWIQDLEEEADRRLAAKALRLAGELVQKTVQAEKEHQRQTALLSTYKRMT